MAQKLDFQIPFNDLTQYVPQNLRNPVIKGLIDNLFNRFMTHDESVPLYGYVGRKPSSPDDHSPLIPESTVERDINAITPVLSFSLGSQKFAFTIQDLINKAEALGVSPGGLQWLYSQSNNYLPPIDIDKFANFFNYFWVAKAQEATPNMPWNRELLPEYYTIAKPKDTDSTKLNVVVATTGQTILTGTGFNDQSFTMRFTSPTTFTLSADNALGLYTTTLPAPAHATTIDNSTYEYTLQPAVAEQSYEDIITFPVTGPGGVAVLLTYKVIRDPIYDSTGVWVGNESFNVDDSFSIDTIFLSLNYNVVFSGSPGIKGKIKSVSSLNTYQTIDGVQIKAGQRVLVWLNSAIENGIYIVGPQSWTRASDYDGTAIATGAQTWVSDGTTNKSFLFTAGAGNAWIKSLGTTTSNTNNWQEGNFWVSSEELNGLGLSRSGVIQAVRPIIEYDSSVQLNQYITNGTPSDSGTGLFKQNKTEFNQLPFFDLYRYDGTHSGLVSSIFYYVEDLTADLDLDLQKRVKLSTSESEDYVFDHGLADANGELLFYRKNGDLKTIWHAGYTEAAIVDSDFISTTPANKGSISNIVIQPYVQQQVWTIQAVTPTRFEVIGSKTAFVPPPFNTLDVGVPYSNADFSCLITAGTVPFTVDDTFVFRIGNLETPRYVFRNENNIVADLYGGKAADLAGVGAYQMPRPFINNPYNESRGEVLEGTLYAHFRGILQNQFPDTAPDYAFGGAIKNWSEQQTLLAALLMQRDMTPISMIDLAEREYMTGLNTIADIYKQSIAQFFATIGVIETDGIGSDNSKLNTLLDLILYKRTKDNDVRTVLYDTTSAVIGIPATLPQLGIRPLVQPAIEFNNTLGRMMLKHHDGHYSSLETDDINFRRALLNVSADIQVMHSDTSIGPAVGSFTTVEPALPYKGQLWIRPNGIESTMLAFNVDYDDVAAPVIPEVGTTWYNRGANILYVWDGVQYVAQPSHSQQWRVIDLADTLNNLLLLVEQRLHNGINPNNRRVDFTPLLADPKFQSQLKRELFSFSAINGLDPLGTDYAIANAFTWNYSNATSFASVNTATVPARWFNALMAHQATVANVIPTDRPNLEPWKLLGFVDFASWWNTLSPTQQASYTPAFHSSDLPSMTNGGSVRAISTTLNVTQLNGLQIVDGVQLSAGDRVLLTNEASNVNNGVYVVSVGTWARAPISYSSSIYFTATNGLTNQGSVWALAAPVTAIDVDPVVFKQVRRWSNALWVDVQTARPTLKLSVDTVRDEVLPPYVNSTLVQSVNALTTTIPLGVANSYAFGDDGPVETVWQSTAEYGYSLARALFRHDPLMFLGFCWGFNWVEVDGILYDGYDLNTPGHKRFRLHGDLNTLVDRDSTAMTITSSSAAYSIVYDAYEVDNGNRYQNFSVRDSNGAIVGYVREGVSSSVGGLVNAKIEDRGQPFRMGDRFDVSATGAITFTPAIRYSYLGFGQTFTNALRETSIDTTDSFAIDAFRNWDVNMGHRAGGLVATNDLKVRTDMATLSSSSFDLVFKKNALAKDLWVQALRITVQQFGSVTPLQTGGFTPKTDGSDWVFKIEGYNPRYLNIEYYNLLTNGTYQTFNVLDKSATETTWKEFTQHISSTATYLPLTITGIQSVVNFLFGYSKFLEDQGWAFNLDNQNNVDAETGRARTYQLEVEKFIDRCYRGIQLEQGHIINPFMDQVWVRQPTGILSEFRDTALFDITGHAGVFDIAGVKFNATDLYAIRGNQTSQFSAAAPMYSAHAQIDEFEHLFIFNYFVEDSIQNGVLYDPFSGSRVVTYKFNGRRQASTTFRPEFGGHYLVGNEVRQNLQASTDNITNFFNANHAFENEETTRHALSLLGFNTKTYFDNLDISDKSQFNFWRGLVQAKGTNLSIDAYLNNNRFEDAKIDEYWAYKVASYGDSRQNTYPELKLNVDDSLQQFTQLQFDADPSEQLVNFTQISRLDESRWFSIDDLDHDAYFRAEICGSFAITNGAIGELYTLPFVADYLVPNASFSIVNSTTIKALNPTVTVVGYGPATPRYNPIKLFNYVDAELVKEIPLWHPAFGQHTPTALESINIISNQNPAKYNFSTQVVNNNTYDPLRPWGSNEIGRVWFDTRNLSYIPYYDSTIFPNRAERLSRWGALADFATIDVYEWVQSSVPPAQYNALAATQAGDADLDPATKAAGEVALQETYVRDRLWSIRPIAWSFASMPIEAAHPAFQNSFDSILYTNIGKSTISLERGLFSDYGIVAGMRIGAWDANPANPKPLSESIITTLFDKEFAGPLPATSTIGAASYSIDLSTFKYTDVVGPLVFYATAADSTPTGGIAESDSDGNAVGYNYTSTLRVTEVDSGRTDIIVIDEAFVSGTSTPSALPTKSVTAGQVVTFDLPTFGIRITVTVTTGGTVNYNAFRSAIVAALGALVAVRDAVQVTPVVSNIALIAAPETLSNDPGEVEYAINLGIGWRAWYVPTQDQLTADGQQPNSSWKPYVGDFSEPGQVPLSTIQDAVAYAKKPLTLNNGLVIQRYSTTWDVWNVLKNTVLSETAITTSPITITHSSNILDSSASVYVNGIAQLKAAYVIVGPQLTLTSVLAGSIATVIIRAYQPSAQELAFDPAVADDLSFQQQYKQDYEYVSLPVRDSEGALTSSLYYFWVKNKSINASNKKLSVQAITQELRDGPPNFLTFQNLIGDGSITSPFRYDAITISGLSYVVAKDDTFKLRFTRNFTLRDDPQQIDLKDTHTEWSLIRPSQRTKIPEALWNKLVDSLAASDVAGNAVPSLRRVLYDERNGSSTRFGFEPEQTLAPRDLLVSSVTYTIVNTKLINKSVPANADGTYPPDFIDSLNFDQSSTWFATPAAARQTMTDIWNTAKPVQINEIFFAALNDILASNYEVTDIFKTSRLSVYSIKVIAAPPIQPTYE